MNRRRSANRKLKEKQQPEQRHTAAPQPEPIAEEKNLRPETPVREEQAGKEGRLPLAVVLEILAEEYEEGGQGDALCRAAVRLAEESGEIEGYRARWDAAQEEQAVSLPVYLFDRRQAMELISYHRHKGNKQALQKEKDKLMIAEGRLLLGQSQPLKITSDDLEKLEEYIKQSGF